MAVNAESWFYQEPIKFDGLLVLRVKQSRKPLERLNHHGCMAYSISILLDRETT